MLHFIIFKFTLKENWTPARFCLMNLPHSWSSVIYLFIYKWLEAGKARIVCKAHDGRFTFISGYLQSCNNTFLYIVYPSRGKIWQCSNLDSPPNRNCGVKKIPPTISSFIFCSLCSLQLPHFPAVEFHWPLMYRISLCFSSVALFGPEVRGWNKADPILKLTGSPKPEPEGSPPQPWPDRGRVRQRCSLLQASEEWGGGEETQQGGLFGVPLTP